MSAIINSYSLQAFKTLHNLVAATPAKLSPKGVMLFSCKTKDGVEVILSVAKGVSLPEGTKISAPGLTIIHGANADGEERYYVTNKANSMFAEADYEAI